MYVHFKIILKLKNNFKFFEIEGQNVLFTFSKLLSLKFLKLFYHRQELEFSFVHQYQPFIYFVATQGPNKGLCSPALCLGPLLSFEYERKGESHFFFKSIKYFLLHS